MTLTACNTSKEGSATVTVPSDIAPSGIKPSSETESVSDEIKPEDSDGGVPFNVDEFLSDELPTEGISVYDAQKIIVETLHPEQEFVVPEGYTMLYEYCGILEIEGEPFYCIDFGAESELEYLVERSFAVSLSGELYEGVPYTDAYAPYELYAAHKDVRGDEMEPISGDEAMTLVWRAIESEGRTSTTVQYEGTEIINGESCWLLSAGEDSLDGQKYTAMYHYAVSESGEIWYMDIVNGAVWVEVYLESE